MSSTFSYKQQVLSEPARDVKIYLDSGWPNDNYEVTTEMALALVSRRVAIRLRFYQFSFSTCRSR